MCAVITNMCVAILTTITLVPISTSFMYLLMNISTPSILEIIDCIYAYPYLTDQFQTMLPSSVTTSILIPLTLHLIMAITALHTLAAHPRDPYTAPLLFYAIVDAILALYNAIVVSMLGPMLNTYYKGQYPTLTAIFFITAEMAGFILAIFADKTIAINFHATFLPHTIAVIIAVVLASK